MSAHPPRRTRRFLLAGALVAVLIGPGTTAAVGRVLTPTAAMVSSTWDNPGPISPCGGCWPNTR